MAPKVLFIHNEHEAPEGLLGDAFVARGYDIETFLVVPPERIDDPDVAVTFPDPTGYDVIVPLGARWSVYDEKLRAGWVGAELRLLRDAAAAGVALLGVCFGGQLLADAFGGTVRRAERAEVGWYDVASADPAIVPPGQWFMWHFDRFEVPPGATEIARTPDASQAFVLGRALALQFHPEITAEILEWWIGADREGTEVRQVGVTHEELRRRTAQLRDDAARRVELLVDGFLNKVATAPVAG